MNPLTSPLARQKSHNCRAKFTSKAQIIAIGFLAIMFSSCGIFIQKTGIKNYTLKNDIPTKGLNKYQYDFIYMAQLLEEGFPVIDSIFPKGERVNQLTIARKQLARKNTTNSDFLLYAQKYLGHVHNQHTTIYLKTDYKYFFPYKIFNSYGDWYLRNIEKNQDSLLIGKKIISINGFPTKEIQNRLKLFVFSENEINQLANIRWSWYYNNPKYLQEINVIHSRKDKLELVFENKKTVSLSSIDGDWNLYKISEQPHPLTRHRKKIYSYHIYPEVNFGYLQYLACHDRDDILEGIESYVKPWLQPIAKAYAKRQFKKKKPSKKIAPYYNTEHPIFKDFVWEMVDSLNKSGVENLIIDLRRNPGGNLDLGIQLLYFLTDGTNLKNFKDYAYTSDIYKKYFPSAYQELVKNNSKVPDNELIITNLDQNLFKKITDPESKYYIPANRPIFKGQIYVIATYQTGSAAAMLATLVQDNNIGTLIGTSVGNNSTGATTFTPLRLPRTKAYFGIATTYQIRPNESKGMLQIPDYWVEYTIEDLATGRDPFLQKALELIKATPQYK